jgi:hypothetical protein
MVLRCPTCQTNAWYVRGDFFGKWVVYAAAAEGGEVDAAGP